MKRIKQLTPALLILALFIGISSCKKEDIDVPDERLRDLFGEWELYSHTGGDNGGTYYPNEEIILIFKENGIFLHYENEVEECKADFNFKAINDYSIGIPYTINSLKPEDAPHFMNNSNFKFRTSDTLVTFCVNCADYPSYYYVRKN